MASQNEIINLKTRIKELEEAIKFGRKEENFGTIIKEQFPHNSERIFRGFIAQSAEGISLINELGLIVDCNEAMQNIYEVHRNDIVGKYIWDFEAEFLTQKKREETRLKEIKKIQIDYIQNIRTKKPLKIESEILTTNKLKYISLTIFPIITENACFVGRIINDITQEKENQIELLNYRERLENLVEERTGELKQSEEKFRLLFEKSHDPILIIDEYNFVECNDAAVHILGYNTKEELYQIHPSKISPDYQPNGRLSKESAQEMMDIAYAKGYNRFEWVHTDKSGKEIYMDVALTIIPYKGKDMIFTVWRDISKQKEYEASILEKEKLFSNLFEQAADGILVGIKDGEIVEANQSMCNLTGYSKEELVGQNIKKLFKNEVLTNQPLRYDLIKKGANVVRERNIVRKDGSLASTEMNTKILDDGRMQALFRDITRRKEAESALKESEEKYRNIFHTAPIGVLHYDLEGTITDCNQNFVDIIGSVKERLIGLNMIKGLKNKELIAAVKKSLKQGQAYFENWYSSVTGNKKTYVRILFKGIQNNNQEIISGIGLVEDITERKKVEVVIKESEEKIRNIFNSSSDIIMIINDKEKVININKAVEKHLGYTPEEFIGKSPKDFINKSDVNEVDARISKMLSGEKVPIHELAMISKSGEKIPAEVNSKAINYEGKRAILSVIRNIKERKVLEQRIFDVMIEAEAKERQRLASDIHDEVGPLLSSLKMYIEMLENKNGDEKQNYINKKLNSLIRESITNVREVSNALSPNLLSQYGLLSAIKSFINNQKELIQIDFKYNINDKRYGIKLETVYYRILKELVNNTLKHAKANLIRIELKELRGKLILKYSDNGIGIGQVKKNSKPKGQGLTNIKTRVKTINGKYKIESEENKGFQFELITEYL